MLEATPETGTSTERLVSSALSAGILLGGGAVAIASRKRRLAKD